MNKIIIILIILVFAGCSQKQDINKPKDIIVAKRNYPNISKNAIFDAAKVLFTLSNENNGNKNFIIDVYRDKLEVSKIIFEYNVIRGDITLDKWQLELYQAEKETRANLIVSRRDSLNEEEIKNIDKNVVNLFWDRLDYLLGLKKDWKECNKYFDGEPSETFHNIILYDFCSDYFITVIPDDKYIQKNILISEQKTNKNTIDTVKADIYKTTGLSLEKSDDDIFNQSENIEDTYLLKPIMTDEIFEIEAQKKAKVIKTQDAAIPDKLGFKTLKDGELLDVDKQMNKFKRDLENIINVKPQNENTNLEKIISESDELKENSEFDFKSKEKNQ
ncbi:hypothetical protein [Arcobacter sp. s6]|uniref:hypothetical protein n=1 Tax=Arcobacter sp. s6 TaxID=3230363 RepID=UPI00349FD25E